MKRRWTTADGPLRNANDVASAFGVSRRSVYRWVAEGRIGYVRIGSLVRFRPYDVEEFAARRVMEYEHSRSSPVVH